MDSNPETGKIEIGKDTQKHLNTLRKWTMFLAVSGFIFLGIIILLGLMTGTFFTAFNKSDMIPGISDLMIIAIFAGVALIIFFPVFFLFRFSKRMSVTLSTLDNKVMHKAVRDIKYFFIIIGILLILIISTYIASLILAGTSTTFLPGL